VIKLVHCAIGYILNNYLIIEISSRNLHNIPSDGSKFFVFEMSLMARKMGDHEPLVGGSLFIGGLALAESLSPLEGPPIALRPAKIRESWH
jgi:hypothetical protein